MMTEKHDKTGDITEISEAVRLHFFDNRRFNTNVISIVWTIPAERDKATKTALIAEILRMGAKGDRNALEERLAHMYGATFESVVLQKGGRQLLALSMEFLTDSVANERVYKNAAALLKEAVEMRFAESALKRASKSLKTILMTKNDSAAEYAVEGLIDIVYPDDSFSIHCEGYAEDIDTIDVRELNEFFNELRESAHTDIFICSHIDGEKAVDTAKSFIGRRRNINRLPVDEAVIAGGLAEKSESRKIGQSRIAVAYTTGLKPWGRQWYTTLVMREVLCGAGASVLYDKVRQQNGLCYYIGGRLMRYRMVLVIDAGVEAGSEEKTVKLIDDGIKGFFLDKDALDAAKKAVMRDFAAVRDRRFGMMNEKLNEMLLGITIDHDYKKEINSITMQEVATAVKKLHKKGVFTINARLGQGGF